MGERLGALLYLDEWEKVEGAPWPLGATWVESCRGFNFALFSRHAATGVTLLLYTVNDPANAVCRYTLDPNGMDPLPEWIFPRNRDPLPTF